MRTSRLLCFLLIVSSGCARGSDGGDGGFDAATPDAEAVDAETADAADSASDDGGPDDDASMDDAGAEDGGPVDGGGGPVACTTGTAAMVCGGRPCVDGFCCDRSCAGVCESCGVAGSEGLCTPHDSGADPDSECAAEAPDTCGTSGGCDGIGACALHGAGVSCDDAMACTMGDACDGAGACRGAAPADCTPMAGNECCLGSCDSSGGCTTTPGACPDTCGGTTLTVGVTCSGCGPARAAGSCLGGAIHVCDAGSLCREQACGGTTYFCTSAGGTFAWRVAAVCDDGNACTFNDFCGGGTCSGSPVTCTSDICTTRTCNGTSACTATPNTGTPCDDSDACTFGDTCSSGGVCTPAGTATCTSSTCLDRTCNGTASCTETPRTGLTCDDGNLCSSGETCSSGGLCSGGSTVTCPPDVTCLAYTCDGTPSCAAMARNVGGPCDDGMPSTPIDICQSDGTCLGLTCSPTLVTVFSDDYTSPSSLSWTSGTDVPVNTSRWDAFTTAQHGVRINSGRLEITNQRSGSPGHGHGYAYVQTDGAGSDYDNTTFTSTLGSNAGHDVVWTFNMRRDDPESTDGGFSCSSTSSQNDRTVGLAYVLASSSATGLNASTGTCSSSGTANGYAVTFGGDGGRLNLVRFTGGLRNGALTNIVRSSSFSRTNYFSVRVTYNADTDAWRLEARSDGSSSFSDPASGSYSSTGMGTDTTYVDSALDYSGPYFQTGCCCLCSSTYTTRFDNVTVGIRCSGG